MMRTNQRDKLLNISHVFDLSQYFTLLKNTKAHERYVKTMIIKQNRYQDQEGEAQEIEEIEDEWNRKTLQELKSIVNVRFKNRISLQPTPLVRKDVDWTTSLKVDKSSKEPSSDKKARFEEDLILGNILEDEDDQLDFQIRRNNFSNALDEVDEEENEKENDLNQDDEEELNFA